MAPTVSPGRRAVQKSLEPVSVALPSAEERLGPFDAQGRQVKKVVAKSGNLDGTEIYYWDGQSALDTTGRSSPGQVIEVRDGSGNVL
jgi:hypothetical protein